MAWYNNPISSLKETFQGVVDKAESKAETLSPQQQFQNLLAGSVSLRASEFISDILGDSVNTPHDEMRDAWRMLQNNIQVANAVSKKALLISGREITVESESDDIVEKFESEILPEFREAFMVAAKQAVAMGNGYIRVVRGENTGAVKGFEPIVRPHKVYVQYGETLDDIQAYIVEAFRRNEGESYQVLVSDHAQRSIRGRRLEPDEVLHLRVGHSAMPKYGRSDFVSGIDDYKISREIKRSLGISARHKMIPRKAFVFNESENMGGAMDEPGETSGISAQKNREDQLNDLDIDENPVFHDVDLDVKDYSYDPDVENMQRITEKLDRDLTSPIPQFLTHAESSNRANSREERNVMQMEITAIRERWRAEINQVFEEIVSQNGVSGDVSIRFGDFDFPTREERVQDTIRMFKNNLLTLGQAVDRLPFDVDVVEEFADAYNFELDTSDNPFDQLSQKIEDSRSFEQSDLDEWLGDEDGAE